MNLRPEIGRYPDPDGGRQIPADGIRRNSSPSHRLRRGPPAGWRMATLASGLIALSAVAGLASLLAGAMLLLPLGILAIPFLIRARNRRRRAA